MSQLDLIAYDPGELSAPIDLWTEEMPIVQWSHSAHACFRRCQKQYLYSYLMASSQAKHDPTRRTAWVLSKLQDLSRWRGRLVDYAIEKHIVPFLKFGNMPEIESAISQTIVLVRRQWEFSEQGIYRQEGLVIGECGDEFCALYEHEYETGVGPSELKQVEAEVTLAIRNLYAMTDFLAILRGHHRYHPQYRISVPFGSGRIKAVLDLLCWNGDQRIITDWKTVENETTDHSSQMLVYAWAALKERPQLTPDDVTLYEVRLYDGVVKEHPVTAERLAATEDFIFESLAEISALTRGKPYVEQVANSYEPARTPRTCAMCNYRKLCLQGVHEH